MKISDMREFISLAKKLNYTRAADELFMSQSLLSRHIESIETELNACLFIRSTHGVELTQEGRLVYPEFCTIVNQYQTLVNTLESHAKGLVGSVKIGILYYAIEDYADSFITPFQHQYADINVSIISHQPASLIDDLQTGKIDLGLTMRVSLPTESNLQIIDIHTEPMIILLPSSHHLSARTKVSIKELAEETFVFIKGEGWHEPYVRKLLGLEGIKTFKYIYTEQIDTLATAIIDNNAIAIVARHVSNMHRKNISHALISEKKFKIVMSLGYIANNRNPALPIFLNAIKPYLMP